MILSISKGWVLIQKTFYCLCRTLSRKFYRMIHVNFDILISKRSFFISIFLVMFNIMVYYGRLNNWWIYDDPYLLELAVLHNPFDFFLKPDVYQSLSTSNFTPLVVLSYALDYYIFGFSPYWFYAHQLILISMCTVLLFFVIRHNGIMPSLVAAILFSLSAPVNVCSGILMTRHYIEGAAWCMITWLLLKKAHSYKPFTWLAGVCFLFAVLCKEVYVPFFLALPFLIDGSIQRRLKTCIPIFVSFVVYMIWRTHMLAGFEKSFTLSNGALSSFYDFGTILDGLMVIGNGFFSWPYINSHVSIVIFITNLLILFFAVFILVSEKKTDRLFGGFILVLGSLLPLIWVWKNICDSKTLSNFRLMLHCTIVYFIIVSFVLQKIIDYLNLRRSIRIFIFFVAFLGIIFSIVNKRSFLDPQIEPLIHQKSLVNEFFFKAPSEKIYVNSFWTEALYLNCIQKFRTKWGDGRQIPSVCTMPFDLRPNYDGQYFIFEDDSMMFKEITASFVEEREKFLNNIVTKNEEFTVDLRLIGGHLSLDLGPDNSIFMFLFGYEPGVYLSFLSKGSLDFNLPENSMFEYYFRFARKTGNDFWVLSPEIEVSFSENSIFVWRN